MSSSIAIPRRRKPRHSLLPQEATSNSSSSAASNLSPSSSSSGSTESHRTESTKRRTHIAGAETSPPASPSTPEHAFRERRPSLLGNAIAKSEHVVVNIGMPDAPRLVTCVKSSQGFDWNRDLFLPSYGDYGSSPSELEHKQDPTEEVVLTDEEAAALLPS